MVGKTPYWAFRPPQVPDESTCATDNIKGTVLGQPLDLTLVSPRQAKVATGNVLLRTTSGQPAVVYRRVGNGKVFLLGFCIQDTYFKTWQDSNPTAREQLAGLLYVLTRFAGVSAHVRSSNPDIEASVRANTTEGFLFVINHEASVPDTVIQLADFDIADDQIVDVADGQIIPFTRKEDVVELSLSIPVGQTRLFHITLERLGE